MPCDFSRWLCPQQRLHVRVRHDTSQGFSEGCSANGYHERRNGYIDCGDLVQRTYPQDCCSPHERGSGRDGADRIAIIRARIQAGRSYLDRHCAQSQLGRPVDTHRAPNCTDPSQSQSIRSHRANAHIGPWSTIERWHISQRRICRTSCAQA